ncbi:hypothetical protein CYLTODRAFT_424908 [Cylindrobasidium torrendii FP15055 ss-10]|uniref:BZIP domain-containing protein n=1 Tax=Cylindrobasidium torrendii FP15055 ss-10 TaxID=1314674 RepID=A0A0D7B3N4_9AGAR|nr:hypothetical protein CYLTODRAFT_424908 [Cylindrobasidium torrendii FP15055 ss-10]
MSSNSSHLPRVSTSSAFILTSNDLIAQVPSFSPLTASDAHVNPATVAPIPPTSAHVERGAQDAVRTPHQTVSLGGRARTVTSQEGRSSTGSSNNDVLLRQRRTLYTRQSRARQEQRTLSLFDTVHELTAEVARLEAANHELEKDVMYWMGYVKAMESIQGGSSSFV